MEGGKLWAPAEKTLDGALEHLADACLIFDDTASVWESHRRNLVTCERYLFFPQARRQFGLSGMSLLEIGQDESEDEGMLSTAMKVFESVHSAYFAGGYDKNVEHKVRALKQHASDVRAVQEILCAQRKKVLADVRIVFSRVFPHRRRPHDASFVDLSRRFRRYVWTDTLRRHHPRCRHGELDG